MGSEVVETEDLEIQLMETYQLTNDDLADFQQRAQDQFDSTIEE